ncbi:MAG: ThuA domain-containing protein, partial [Tepidisphaeraceae bacterium]
MSIRVTIWHEYRHEKKNEAVRRVYPEGIHTVLAKRLQQSADLQVRTATLDEPEQGLTDDVLKWTDVMLWWGHGAHGEVPDTLVDKVQQRVLEGMGLIVLHSGHHSKIFRRLMGTSCNLKWRVADDREVLWVTKPLHPITAGINDHFILPHEEMYGECFDVPEPMETLLISSFSGGEVFR